MSVSVVYSERFLSYSGPDAMLSYVVPYGRRAVVKGLSGSNLQSPGAQVYVGAAGVYAFVITLAAATQGFYQELRLVAYAGESIIVATYGPVVRVHLSGYLFLDDAGAPASPATLPAVDQEWPAGPPADHPANQASSASSPRGSSLASRRYSASSSAYLSGSRS